MRRALLKFREASSGREQRDRRPISLIAFTVVGGRIAEVDAIADPERLSRLVGPVLTEE